MPLIDPQLKEILICPHCHGDLEEDEPQSKLRCTKCGLAYFVREGIPVMLIDEAEKPPNWTGAVAGSQAAESGEQ